jgi:hypothetical protein
VYTDPTGLRNEESAGYVFGAETAQNIETDSNRISQNQLRPEAPSGPCFYRTLQAAAEEKTGIDLTMDQITEATKSLSASGAIGAGGGEPTYFVKKPAEVVKDALARLGFPNAEVTIGNLSTSINGVSDYTARFILSKGHFQLGDSTGNLLWEPYTYNDPANAYTRKPDAIRTITIILEPEVRRREPTGDFRIR